MESQHSDQKMLLFSILFLTVFSFAYAQLPIPISSIEELQMIGIDPMMPLDGNYILTKDIDASDTRNWNGGLGFDPIGDELNPFMGLFDGNGHKIQGLWINRPEESSVGLFAKIGYRGEVVNTRFQGARVKGEEYVGIVAGINEGRIYQCQVAGSVEGNIGDVGGIVGLNIGGRIENSSANFGTVYGYHAGGIAGMNEAGSFTPGIIALCSSSLRITGPETVGGVVGYNNGQLYRSFSTGFIKGGYSVGGLVGFNGVSGTIEDCFSTGAVEGLDVVGGLIGENDGSVSRTYSTGFVYCYEEHYGGLIGISSTSPNYSYWDIEASKFSGVSYGEGKMTSDMIRSSNYETWDFVNIWSIIEGQTYPWLRGHPLPPGNFTVTLLDSPNGLVEIEEGTVTFLPWSPVTLIGTPNEGFYLAGWFGSLFRPNNPVNCQTNFRFAISSDVSVGATFLPNVVPISTIVELQRIGNDNFYPLWWNYELMTDIDAIETVGWNEGKGFDPIGNEIDPFTGSINGNGHKISQLLIDRLSVGEWNVGLVSYNKGLIFNLIIETSTITGGVLVGCIAGVNEGGIGLCGGYEVTVAGSQVVGGLVGYDSNGIVDTCYFVGEVSGDGGVGGAIGGIGYDSLILRSYSEGYVYCNGLVAGGFIGSNSGGVIENCFSACEVTGIEQVGGFVGANAGYITNCYSVGYVQGNIDVGGFAGKVEAPPKVANSCYWDIETSGQTTSPEGIGKTTAEMKQSVTFEDWDFVSIWRIVENVTYPFLRNLPPPFSYRVEVPDLEGLTPEEAEIVLLENGLILGGVSEECNNSVPENTIFQQAPRAGTLVPIDSPVDVTVAICCVEVPNVIGELLENAITILTNNNLQVGEVSYFPSSQPENTVIGQYPNGGEIVRCQSSVFLAVSTGPEGEGVVEGEGVIEGEGTVEGVVEGEGVIEGEGTVEGVVEGEGVMEGEGITEGVIEGEVLVEDLEDGVPVTDISGAQGSMRYYRIVVPLGQESLLIRTWGGEGDCDLYVKYGSLPTLDDWDYRPYVWGNDEIVNVTNPSAGSWYIMLHGYEAYSGVSLLADYSAGVEGEGFTEGEGVIEGEGTVEGVVEGEGVIEGEGFTEGEGVVEGEGTMEGLIEGEGVVEGVAEGEGVMEGEGEYPHHSADQNGDWQVNLSELLRVIQFFNFGGYHCAIEGEESEDGYIPGYDGDKSCAPHASDYNPQDWTISLSELLRLIQFFNMGSYHPCPGVGEDGYCPGSL